MAEAGETEQSKEGARSAMQQQHHHQQHHLPHHQGNPESDFAKPWLLQTVAQAQELKRTVVRSTDTALHSARSQLLDLHSTSSHHLHSFQELAHEGLIKYGEFEDMFFQKLKEGLHAAATHPAISLSTGAGIGLLLMKRPRMFLFRHTIGRFQSEESLLENSEKRVKELRQSVDLLKNESKKLEERAMLAEEELQRGHTKLRHAGKQVQSLVSSIYKTEGQASGLIDNLRELSGRDALRMRAEVATMASEAKQQRMALIKRVRKIADYGIPV